MSNRKERRDAAEHRELILQTARSLFDEHGVEAVSMHQIAKTAGVGQGTLYRRYTHKSELCMDLMQDRSDRFMEETRVFLEENHSAAPLEQFEGVIARWAAFVEDQWKWLGIFAGPNCEER